MVAPATTPWTAERVRELRRLAEDEHLPSSYIAEVFGMTRNAVVGKCLREGIQLGKPKNKNVQVIRAARRRPFRAKAAEVGERLPDRAAITREAPEMGLVSLFDLQPHHCRYIVDDGGQTFYCGNIHHNNSRPYCSFHYPLIYQRMVLNLRYDRPQFAAVTRRARWSTVQALRALENL